MVQETWKNKRRVIQWFRDISSREEKKQRNNCLSKLDGFSVQYLGGTYAEISLQYFGADDTLILLAWSHESDTKRQRHPQ